MKETTIFGDLSYRSETMQTAVEIDFQGMDAKLDIRTAIAKHVAQLEERFGRVTAGRVVVKAPGGHHRTGGLYEINIRLALPDGREVNVDRTAQADERHSDLAVSYTHLRAHETVLDLVCRLLLEKK